MTKQPPAFKSPNKNINFLRLASLFKIYIHPFLFTHYLCMWTGTDKHKTRTLVWHRCSYHHQGSWLWPEYSIAGMLIHNDWSWTIYHWDLALACSSFETALEVLRCLGSDLMQRDIKDLSCIIFKMIDLCSRADDILLRARSDDVWWQVWGRLRLLRENAMMVDRVNINVTQWHGGGHSSLMTEAVSHDGLSRDLFVSLLAPWLSQHLNRDTLH